MANGRTHASTRDRLIIGLALGLGLAIRWWARDYTTRNTFAFVLPWYAFVQRHGVESLAHTFTNYAPFYSYCLIVASWFGAVASPLWLIKSISFAFEAGCGVMAWRIVRALGDSPTRAAWAFAAVWLAPTVLYNGALWAEADSIWTFFVLWSIWLYCRGRDGVLAFGVALAVKAQAVFLGPFVLAIALRDRRRLPRLLAVPVVYVALALPVLLAGGPFLDALTVYARQGETFRYLTLNAANVWVLVPNGLYGLGVPIGLALSALVGVALTWFIGSRNRADPEFVLLTAATVLLAMPFVLPKMLDRYFYAYEVAAIVLAFVNPRYAPFAVMAQVDGVLAYLVFDRDIGLGLRAATLCNGAMLAFLLRDIAKPRQIGACALPHWLGYAALTSALFAFLFLYGVGARPAPLAVAGSIGLAALITGQSVALLDRSARRTIGSRSPSRVDPKPTS